MGQQYVYISLSGCAFRHSVCIFLQQNFKTITAVKVFRFVKIFFVSIALDTGYRNYPACYSNLDNVSVRPYQQGVDILMGLCRGIAP